MSDFTEGQLNPDTGIDFSKAVKLPGGGSTCDTYKAIFQRRKVFVKRLKPKFRNMPLYLSAFDKEYDIGVNLSHSSLPKYTAFYEDYIVMDFIDGKTLADMIKDKDPWLSKEKNVIKMMRQLLEVIDYLHQHNVVHCDIKPDNIMITAGNRNLMLIDLDKCYTDWLDDTSGDPSKYAVLPDKRGDKSIDFHGIGMITGKLIKTFDGLSSNRLEMFKQECMKEDTEIDNLQALLVEKSNTNKIWLMSIPLFGLVIAGMIIWRPRTNHLQAETIQVSVPKDTIVIYHEPPASASTNALIETVTAPINSVSPKSAKTDYKQEIEKEMPGRFTQMYALMDKAEELLADSLSSDDTLRNISFEMAIAHSDIMLESYEYFEKKYSNINATDIQMTVAQSNAQKNVIKRWDEIQRRITDVIESRR